MNENVRDQRSPVPAANILRTDQGHVIEVALPGLTRDQIQVELKDGLLVLQHVGADSEGEATRYARREFDLSGFRRTFRLPESADVSQIEARFEAGILYLAIPARQPVVRPVTIR